MVLLNVTYLLDMLVSVIIKLCNFYVLYFCEITYYSYHLLHIMFTILLNVIFYSFLVLLNVLTYLLNMLVLVIIKLCNFMFYIFVKLHIIFTFCYILCLQYYLMLYFFLFLVLLNFLTYLLDMLVLAIIKLYNFHVLYF